MGVAENRRALLGEFFAGSPVGNGAQAWFHRDIRGMPHHQGPVCWCDPVVIGRGDFTTVDQALRFIEAHDRPH